ncbi:DUF2694 domain-containing protein [Mycobacterium kansasii]|uniref:ESX-1 secretion-associated protein EspH n=1 Tax=Mycobacterium attenuatum TaxID=2341086 RepID=A0A498QD45_9MYCO|nr:DUF2694 domain-containing protein [Mycobacterium attenuatum]ORB85653.1 DUF2694 domain-containing protein [Mycobacterium kansasii]VBA44228.1 ESX-1 secretion-associated protein EspH [Mycobacterium attenuatum]VBA60344.1 ESX-1 secretion-associated protein EspH [Mycobacterium attenuatum]VBA62254.1 ESX-1 secretion-associated protein EspH [Mycobacterium attenuatum]
MDLPGNDYVSDDFDALDFTAGTVEESSLDALDEYAPSEPADTDAEDGLDALHGLTEKEEEPEFELFTVTNPAGSVSVTAMMGGIIQQIAVTDKASSMTESGLAEEIFVIADLARQKARAAQHTFMMESMSELAGDGEEANALLREFVGMTLNLPTPEEAAEAEAEVFATRYEVDYTSRYNER